MSMLNGLRGDMEGAQKIQAAINTVEGSASILGSPHDAQKDFAEHNQELQVITRRLERRQCAM